MKEYVQRKGANLKRNFSITYENTDFSLQDLDTLKI